MRNLNSPDQYDIFGSDEFVPDGISRMSRIAFLVLLNLVVLSLRLLLNPDISLRLLENFGEQDQITSMNFKVFFATCFANVSSVIVSLGCVCFCIEICSFQSRCS